MPHSTENEAFFTCDPTKEIQFEGDFKERTERRLLLRSITTKNLLFKLKTTSPHKFAVRPYEGVLSPGESQSITINLLPFYYRPKKAYKDKFLAIAGHSEVEENDFSKAWSLVQDEQKQQVKLTVKYIYRSSSGLPGISEDEGGLEEDRGRITEPSSPAFQRPSSLDIRKADSGTVSTNQSSEYTENDVSTSTKLYQTNTNEDKTEAQPSSRLRRKSVDVISQNKLTKQLTAVRRKLAEERFVNIKLKEERYQLDRQIFEQRQERNLAVQQEVILRRSKEEEEEERIIILLLMAVIGVLLGKYIF